MAGFVRRMFACFACLAGSQAALADQPPPDFGFHFAVVDHPGNAARQLASPSQGITSAGRVDYTYRITTTEVTNGQWLEFVRAYAPFTTPDEQNDTQLLGASGIIHFGTNPQGVPQYVLQQDPNRFVDPGWRYAARFVNWLGHGKPPAGVATAADFATGAYDTSTFRVENGVALDQRVHTSGALYWIPTADEWVKAAYFDPNRYGPDQPGYWDYPITSDTAPIQGLPGQGGQTNAGIFPPSLAVGQYPDVQSPWGLLDVSGGAREYLENVKEPFDRLVAGSGTQSISPPVTADLFVRFRTSSFTTSGIGVGLRVASAIPAPASALVCSAGLAYLLRRRRRHEAQNACLTAGGRRE